MHETHFFIVSAIGIVLALVQLRKALKNVKAGRWSLQRKLRVATCVSMIGYQVAELAMVILNMQIYAYYYADTVPSEQLVKWYTASFYVHV
jgi:hypothetical protein